MLILSWGDDIRMGLYKVSLTIDSVIYNLIDGAYKIILLLSNAQLLNSNQLQAFVDRVYTIIGVIMLFILAYSLLKALVNPDESLKGKQSPQKAVMNLVITIVLITIMPMAFELLYEVQSRIINNNTIGKVILGTSDPSGASDTVMNGGSKVSTSVFQTFFHLSDDYCQTSADEELSVAGKKNCSILYLDDQDRESYEYRWTFGKVMKSSESGGSFKNFSKVIDTKIGGKYVIDDDILSYSVIASAIAGAVTLYIFISYCISLGFRAVKLAFYQVIAPVPILARLLPSENGSSIFSKWLKATATTFLEVFIRLAAIFFAIQLIAVVDKNWDTLFRGNQSFVSGSPAIMFLTRAFIILGILTFAKQAPKLIGDIFGFDSSQMGLGIKSQLGGIMGAGILGGVAGAATGGLGGAIGAARNGGSFGSGLLAGAIGGAQGKGNQWKKQATNQYQKLTGDYKGKAGLFGGASLGTVVNKKAADANKASAKKAQAARDERAAAYQAKVDASEVDYQSALNKHQNEVAANDEMIKNFEESSIYKSIRSSVGKDEKVNDDIRIASNNWLYEHQGASEAEKNAAFLKIREERERAATIEKMKSGLNEGKGAYSKDSKFRGDVEGYLAALNNKEALSKKKIEKKDVVISSKEQKQLEKDRKVEEALGKKKQHDNINDVLEQLMKENSEKSKPSSSKDAK